MRATTRALVAGGLIVAAVAVGVGVVLMRSDPSSQSSQSATARPDRRPTVTTTTLPPSTLPPTTTTTAPPGLPLPLVPSPVRIAWAGDSVAGTLAAAIGAEANARGIEVVTRTNPGCGMVRGVIADESLVPLEFTRPCEDVIRRTNAGTGASGADVVTWFSTWETANRIVDGQAYEFGTPAGDAMLLALIDESAQQLMAGGARLVFLTMPPNTTGPKRPTTSETDAQRALHLNDLFRQYAAAHPDRVAVLDLAALVCPAGPPCPTEVEGVTLRPVDGGHFAGDGPAWVAPRVLDRLVGPA